MALPIAGIVSPSSSTDFLVGSLWSHKLSGWSSIFEARWLRSPRVANDYCRYWLRTPGAQPRNYSTWLADSVWATHLVHPNQQQLLELLPDLIENFEQWEKRHYVPEVGLFWQTGHDDGMEFNIIQPANARHPARRTQLSTILQCIHVGGCRAIASVARLAGRADVAKLYDEKAEKLNAKMLELMWDEKRQFFFSSSEARRRTRRTSIKAID